MRAVELAILGVAIGAYGTLVGAGGGFVLVPLLLLLYPEESAGTITSISLAVVFVNALSGTIAFARQRRLHYHAGALFAASAVPGSIAGALVARAASRGTFDALFGVLLFGLGLWLLSQRRSKDQSTQGVILTRRSLWTGALLSSGIGVISSFFGIGGGVIQVPMMTRLLRFPVIMATATSQLILVVMSFTGTAVHILGGEFQTGWRRTAALSVGVFVGAQIGAALARRINSVIVTRLLAVALLLVGLRLVAQAMYR